MMLLPTGCQPTTLWLPVYGAGAAVLVGLGAWTFDRARVRNRRPWSAEIQFAGAEFVLPSKRGAFAGLSPVPCNGRTPSGWSVCAYSMHDSD